MQTQPVAAEVVIPCHELDETVAFFTDHLGFRLDAVFPADHPAVAVVSEAGLSLRLDTRAVGEPGTIRLRCADPASFAGGSRWLKAPNGTVVELVDVDGAVEVPALRPELVVNRATEDAHWVVGRAGMRYRDLIPGRLGGRFIASHIVIPDAGPVPDYVHFHLVRFQMIFCRTGWVRVVYEDQGEPFVLQAGDCVVQPPRIRHRVLESSGGLEVIEISCPAEHETRVDHELALPNGAVDPTRDFGGQRFVRHVAASAPWRGWLGEFEYRDTGIGAATGGLAGARVLRTGAIRGRGRSGWLHEFDAELHLFFVLAGAITLRLAGVDTPLAATDSVTVPSGTPVGFADASPDLELLEVSLPDVPGTRSFLEVPPE